MFELHPHPATSVDVVTGRLHDTPSAKADEIDKTNKTMLATQISGPLHFLDTLILSLNIIKSLC